MYIEYISMKELLKFPLPLLGRIAAGFPIEAITQRESLHIGDWFQQDGRFAVKLKEGSLTEENIFEGDIILCKTTATANEGDLVVAVIDQQKATLKRIFYRDNGTVTLLAGNDNVAAEHYAKERVAIHGVYMGVVRLSH